MFDIGFFELLVVAIVALVVVGPERLPETARAVGLWIGRLKRSLRETRSELERQIGADDIRRQLHNEDVMRSLEATRRQVQKAVSDGTAESADANTSAKTETGAGPTNDQAAQRSGSEATSPDASSAAEPRNDSTP